MPGLPIVGRIQRALREAKRRKLLQAAGAWPKVEAQINAWKVVASEDGADTFATGSQAEASFHFVLNGEYFGGYLRSAPMSPTAAERAGGGSQMVSVRYNPASPDETVVLAEDNVGRLPFEIAEG